MKRFTLAWAGILTMLMPIISLAQPRPGFEAFGSNFLGSLSLIINAALPVVITLALLLFLWGLVKFIMAAGNEEARASGKQIMIWGIVALFVMVTVWGLVGFLNDITGVGQDRGVITPDPVTS
jgi:hypothetical protein